MPVIMAPGWDDEMWPTLGPLVCEFIEECLCFGPGDLLGEPARLDDEKRFFIWRMYEIYRPSEEMAGRRRFERVALSLPKGCAKTELAAWIAAAELHPDAPVRFDGWNRDGTPKGRPVVDPYVPMFAYTEEQTELLAYGALKSILEESPIAADFDIGLQRIMRRRGDGKCEARASSPNSADGARTTFSHFDETHRFLLPHHHELHMVNLGNISKRQYADGWSLETTTAPEPGAGSVAEGTMEYAMKVASGEIPSRNFFFFHRQAAESHDLTTEDGARAALLESYGPVASQWANIEAKVNLWYDPQYPFEDWCRFFGNMMVKSSARAFDVEEWKALYKPGYTIPGGALVTIGFDGARFVDATALVMSEVETGFLQVLGIWERPYGLVGDGWQVPVDEVEEAIKEAFERWGVWRFYADPPYWQEYVAKWAGQYGREVVVEWYTNRRRQMTSALEAFQTAIKTGALSHDGHTTLAQHVANAHRKNLRELDEQGKPLYLIQKERSDSPFKIDACMAAVLANEARNDAVASGVTGRSIYEDPATSLFL